MAAQGAGQRDYQRWHHLGCWKALQIDLRKDQWMAWMTADKMEPHKVASSVRCVVYPGADQRDSERVHHLDCLMALKMDSRKEHWRAWRRAD